MSEVSDESSITAEWLDTILAAYFTFNGPHRMAYRPPEGGSTEAADEDDDNGVAIRVLDFKVRPGCEEGDNLLSDLLAIDVTFTRSGGAVGEDGTPASETLHLMAKLLSQDPFCRHFIIEAGFDVREIHFYTTLVPALTAFCRDDDDAARLSQWPIPLCYYAKYRQGTDSILVMQNLKEVGYSMADFTVGLSLSQACAAVRAVAHIHAAALSYRVREGISLTEAFPFLFRPEAAAESYQQLLERGLPQLSSFLHTSEDQQLHHVLAKLHKLRPKARETIADLLRPSSSISTLTHIDFWCNNLLFRHGEDQAIDCSVVDWQMVTYSRPTNDLALLLVTSVSGDVRRTHTGDVLDAYWQTLTSHCRRFGLDVQQQLNYTRKDLQEEYQESLLLAVLLGIGSVDLAIGHPDTEQRLCQVLLDLSNDQVF